MTEVKARKPQKATEDTAVNVEHAFLFFAAGRDGEESSKSASDISWSSAAR